MQYPDISAAEKPLLSSHYALTIAMVAAGASIFFLLPDYRDLFTFYAISLLAFSIGGVGPGIASIALNVATLIFIFQNSLREPFLLTYEHEINLASFVVVTALSGSVLIFQKKQRDLRAKTSGLDQKQALCGTDEALSSAIETSRLGAWRLYSDEQSILISENCTAYFGLPLGVTKFSYQKFLSNIHPSDRERVEHALQKAISEKTLFNIEHRMILPNGAEHWLYEHGRPIFANDGRLERVDGITVKLTDLRLEEQKKRDKLNSIKTAFDNLNEAIIIADHYGNLTTINEAAYLFFRFKSYKNFPKTSYEFSDLFEISTLDDSPVSFYCNLAVPSDRRIYELKFRRKDTNEQWYGLAGYSAILDDKKQIVGSVSTALDITDRINLQRHFEEQVEKRTAHLAEKNRKLFELARHDELTGLNNRAASNQRVRSEFSRMKRTGDVFSLLLLDIDFFKRVNDSHGHAVGDDVLKQVAETLSNSLREYDFIARWGGEEFLVLLPSTKFRESRIVAEKLRLAIESTPHPTVGITTVSIGATIATSEDINEEIVLLRADEALYQAKRSGRNCVVVKQYKMTEQE